MNDPKFFQTRMGAKFFEGTVPRLVDALERIANALDDQRADSELMRICQISCDFCGDLSSQSKVTVGDSFGKRAVACEDCKDEVR